MAKEADSELSVPPVSSITVTEANPELTCSTGSTMVDSSPAGSTVCSSDLPANMCMLAPHGLFLGYMVLKWVFYLGLTWVNHVVPTWANPCGPLIVDTSWVSNGKLLYGLKMGNTFVYRPTSTTSLAWPAIPPLSTFDTMYILELEC